jgi:nitric oxide reductase large subunit
MEFWQVLGDTASVLQVVTVVASVYAAVKLWQQNRRLRALAQNTPPIENFADL